MTDAPWSGDACSLVDAFRAGERSPVDELDATLAAIEASDLNCFSFLDPDRARRAAEDADVSKPFGGVPIGIKELDHVEGWPYTEASLVFKDRVARYTSTSVQRIVDRGGANPVGLTTASEFGGLNVSITKLNGVCHNPWQHGKTAGGSSGGSGSAVAGGLVTIATGGDGGGSIRIPAGYNGLLGMKGTYGRIPRGPEAYIRPSTVVLGCMARSVRDAARWYDVCSGYDTHDPTSLPRIDGWEADLGTRDLAGLKVAFVPDLGGGMLDPGVADHLRDAAEALCHETGMVLVDHSIQIPNLAAQWMMGNLATLLADLQTEWPKCAPLLTEELATGIRMSTAMYNLHTAAVAEKRRVQANEAMAEAFDQFDLLLCATNPGPAFDAEASMSATDTGFVGRAQNSRAAKYAFRGSMGLIGAMATFAPKSPNAIMDYATEKFPELTSMGALTMISNLCGNPAVSIPCGTIGGLPVGVQVCASHHADKLLFDVALAYERMDPWPLVAPSVADCY